MVLTASNNGHFFHAILSNVADPQVPGQWIEAESPRLTEPERPNLRSCVRPAAKRIVAGNRVGQAGVRVVHVDAEDLGEMGGQVLAVALRVLLRTGVSHRDVKKTIRTESDAAAAVVLGRAHNFPQPP